MTRLWRCGVYFDPETTTRLGTIDFGVVEEDTSKSLTLYIKNLEDRPVFDIEYHHDNNDVQIKGPKKLEIMEVQPLYVYWNVKPSSVVLNEDWKFTAKLIRTVIV